MLDSDLANLYNVETKRINEAVKNNPYKFPDRFCFRISKLEYNCLKSKISTSTIKGGSGKGHNVFTEQGVDMLATILKSRVAIKVSIEIMYRLDIFKNDLMLLEVEGYNNQIKLPSELKVEMDVTNNPNYSNKLLAHHMNKSLHMVP